MWLGLKTFKSVRCLHTGASREGTREFRKKFVKGTGKSNALVPKTGWTISRIGFGSHRLSKSTNGAEALVEAVEKHGINVIDTGSWFEQGNSEKLVGQALDSLFKRNVKRNNIVLLSKSGPVPDSLYSLLPNDVAKTALEYGRGARHCISPEFLEWAIGNSMKRMGVDHLDLWGLDGLDKIFSTSDRHSAMDQISKAFLHLEEEKKRGRIGGYFLSTASGALRGPNQVDIPQLYDFVNSVVGGTDNFIGIEYPFNLYERACLEQASLGQFCQDNGLWQLHNRPLNVITPQGVVTTLSSGVGSVKRALTGDYSSSPEVANDDELQDTNAQLSELFQEASDLEQWISNRIMDEIDEEEGVPQNWVWAHALLEHSSRLMDNVLATRHFLSMTLKPNFQADVDSLMDTLPALANDGEFMKALTRLEKLLMKEIGPRMEFCAMQTTAQRNYHLNGVLRSLIPMDERPMDLLAATALTWTATAEPGLSKFAPPFEEALRETLDLNDDVARLLGEAEATSHCTLLVGARQPPYVSMIGEMLKRLDTKPLDILTWRRISEKSQ